MSGDNLDIVENEAGDVDMFQEDVDSVFPSKFSEATALKIVAKDSPFILNLSADCSETEIAASLSDNSIIILDAVTLDEKQKITNPHAESITGLSYSPVDSHVLYTSSSDQTIKMWDSRVDGKSGPSRCFVDSSQKTKKSSDGRPRPPKPLVTFDVSCDDRLICAGTEQVLTDSFLLFWDTRESSLVGGYWESHDDDITAVRFHPEVKNKLASGSTDGIVNVFDVAQTCEDDALETTINTDSSVQKLTWFHGKTDRFHDLACITHTEEILLWNIDDTGPFKTFSRDDVCAGIRRKQTEKTYIVDAIDRVNRDEQGLTVLAASSCPHNPCLRWLHLRKNRLKPLADLRPKDAGFSELTRCSAYLKSTNGLCTGGEDGVIRLWVSN